MTKTRNLRYSPAMHDPTQQDNATMPSHSIVQFRTTIMAASLGVFLLLNLPFVNADFCDESDNLVGGMLISQGWVVYRDYFSQHAPLPHLLSAVVHFLFGKGWALQRWSVALIGLVNLWQLMALTRRRPDGTLFYALALFAILWPFYAVLYWGYMVLADNIAAYATLPMAALVVDSLWNRARPSVFASAWLGVNLFMAGMSNPLMIYPAVVCLVGFAWASWRRDPSRQSWTIPWRPWIGLTLGGLAPGIGLVAYFLGHGALDDCWDWVFEFNREVYAPGDLYLGEVWHHLGNLWSPLQQQPWDFGLVHRSEDPGGNDSWAYFGLAGRLGIVAVAAWSLLRRSALAGLVLYGLAAASLTRQGFHTQPFRVLELLCLCVSAVIVFGVLRRRSYGIRLPFAVPALGLALVNILVIANAALEVSRRGVQCRLDPNLPHYRQLARECRSLVGAEAKAFFYPLDFHLHYATGYEPAGYFFCMVPWTCQRPQDKARVLSDLRRGARDRVLVVFPREFQIWGRPSQSWAREIYEVLDAEYREVRPNWYVPRQLAAELALRAAP